MAESFYKMLHPQRDVTSTRTLLHEAIPITGSIPSGTYGDDNIKNYTHGMFQSVYDYPHLSSSANHIFDITLGISSNSNLYSSVSNQQSKKTNIYNQMAQILVGHDVTGGVLQFDEQGETISSGTKMTDVLFLNMDRILVKDEIKKGTFEMVLGMSSSYDDPFTGDTITITDKSGSDGYLVNSPAGEYGILYATGSCLSPTVIDNFGYTPVGLLYYQAGIVALTASVFQEKLITSAGLRDGTYNTKDADDILSGSNIQTMADNFRKRLYNLQCNNTIELNSTVYFCRVNHNEFNYSTNQTYLSQSKIQVKTKSTDVPVSYITTVGLYNDNNELLAVAKLSEPLKKDPANEFTIRVRLDY